MGGHWVITSSTENPFFRMACTMSSLSWAMWKEDPRATKLAPAASASLTMSNAGSMLPADAVDAIIPAGVVGEIWPPVMP